MTVIALRASRSLTRKAARYSRLPARLGLAVYPLVALLLVGCTSEEPPTHPIPPEEPQPVIGSILFACSHWKSGVRPVEDRILTNIFFAAPGDDQNRPVSPEEEAIVTSRGAKVVYRFHVPAIRVEIATDSIPPLYAFARINHARSVPLPQRQDISALVKYNRAVTDTDSQFVSELGGVIKSRYDRLNLLTIHVPDAAVPRLRAAAGVAYVHPDMIACGGV